MSNATNLILIDEYTIFLPDEASITFYSNQTATITMLERGNDEATTYNNVNISIFYDKKSDVYYFELITESEGTINIEVNEFRQRIIECDLFLITFHTVATVESD